MSTVLLIIAALLIVVQARVIVYMAWDQSYGCFTRATFNLMYPMLRKLGYTLLAGDIDKFKAHNTAHGHEEVNRMVARSVRRFFQCCRLGDIVFRLYSGDEFIIATKARNTEAMISNIQSSFAAEGMTITLVVVAETLDTTMVKVLNSKKGN